MCQIGPGATNGCENKYLIMETELGSPGMAASEFNC